MRVAYVSFEGVHYALGGLGRMTTSIARAVKAQGITPVFIVPAFKGLEWQEAPRETRTFPGGFATHVRIVDGIEVVEISAPLLDDLALYPSPADILEVAKACVFGSTVGALLPDFNVNVVHLHDVHGVHVIPFAREDGIPVVATSHLLHPHCLNLHFAEKIACECADVVTTVSAAYAAEHAAFFANAKRFQVIRNGIDLEYWAPHHAPREEARRSLLEHLGLEDLPMFLYVGRLSAEHKGVDLLAEAAVRLLEHEDANFVFAGERPAHALFLDAMLERAPRRVRVLDRAHSPHEVRSLYAACDHLVCPSRFEPFGLVQVEAAAMRCTPLVARTGGLAEASDMLFGERAPTLQFAPNDVDDMVQCLLRNMRGTSLPNTPSPDLAGFGMERVGREYAALYRALLT